MNPLKRPEDLLKRVDEYGGAIVNESTLSLDEQTKAEQAGNTLRSQYGAFTWIADEDMREPENPAELPAEELGTLDKEQDDNGGWPTEDESDIC